MSSATSSQGGPDTASKTSGGEHPTGVTFFPGVATGLLVLWCVLGLWFTTQRLISPAVGWRPVVAEEASGVIGLPLDEADEVTAIRDIIGRAPAGPSAWLVVYPPDTDPVSLAYVRSQLLHTEFPRVVEVITTNENPKNAAYEAVIIHPRIEFGENREPLDEQGGFVAYPRDGR